jgi:hypothetical protein
MSERKRWPTLCGFIVAMALILCSFVPVTASGPLLKDLEIRIEGTARLFEGTSCTTRDLEDTQVFVFTVPPGATIRQTIDLANEEIGSDDTAHIVLAVSNQAVESETRLVVASGSMHIVDDEPWPWDDEEATISFDGQATLRGDRVSTVVSKQECVGEEVRVELDITASLLPITIPVNTNDHEFNTDGDCSLWEAITAANTNADVDACPGGAATMADIVSLEASSPIYILTYPANHRVGLPEISTEMTIVNNHSSAGWSWIERAQASDTPDFGVFSVTEEGTLTLKNISVRFGKSDRGAGIYNLGTLELDDSYVTANTGRGISNRGRARLTNSVVRANNGGGIVNYGTMDLDKCKIHNNSAGQGGGILNVGTMKAVECTISTNVAWGEGGGGIYIRTGGRVELIRSTISHNTARGYSFKHGGGIFNGGTAILTNCTVAHNQVNGSENMYGGGIYVTYGTARLTNCTVANNSINGDVPLSGGGILNWQHSGSIVLKNTIVAHNSKNGAPDNCGGHRGITDGGHNLQFPGTDCGSSITEDDPRLAPLRLNKPGKTETIALLAGSAAIDAADDSTCPATDQRGVDRPQGKACDIGAYEFPPFFVYNVRALIEGQSRLEVLVPVGSPLPSSFQWHHIKGVAPGRLGGTFPTAINGELWEPMWPDLPDPENRDCDCESSEFGMLPDPDWPYTWPYSVVLELVEARGGENSVRIVHAPSPDDYWLVVEFDDTDTDGAAWYVVNIYYLTELTAIDLVSLTACPAADRILLAWQTGTEVDNAGFNLHRATSADGPYAKLNDALIPAEGDPESGASYTYTDTDVVKGVTYYYKLEDVDIHGVSTFHGPVSATPDRIHRVYLPLVLK